jgi:NDP-sugar pyrophosphorylase family protein
MKPTLLVLAAGIGSRYGGLKQADKVGPSGETIIDYSIYDAIQAGFGKIVMVVRQNILEDMKALFDPRWGDKIMIEYAIQEVNVPIEGINNLPERKKPWGTGHAVMVAKHLIHEPFAVINADDFYGSDAFITISNYLKNGITENENAMVGYILKNTLSDHGFVSRGICETDSNNYLNIITERTNIERINGDVVYKDTEEHQTSLDENSYVSMNFWGFMPSFFEEAEAQFKEFVKANCQNEKAEFFIPAIVSKMMSQKELRIKVLESTAQWMGVTYIEDKPVVEEKISRLVKAGSYPEKLV